MRITNDLAASYGKWLRKTMKSMKVSQRELIRRSGLAVNTVSGIVTYKQDPRISTVMMIADALDLRMVFVPKERKDDAT